MPRVIKVFLKRIALTIGAFGLGFVSAIFGLGYPVEVAVAVAAVMAVATGLLEAKAKRVFRDFMLTSGEKPLELGPPRDTQRQFKVPNQIKDLLEKISEKSQQVEDQQFRPVLSQMCLDIEKYFQSSSNDKKDAPLFRDRLTEVLQVLEKYVEVQNNSRYFDEPETELLKGKESIKDFSQYVLISIKRGHAASLLEYTVNTKILEAHRYL